MTGSTPRLRETLGRFDDRRKPWLIEHSVAELVAQRVYGGTCKNSDGQRKQIQ